MIVFLLIVIVPILLIISLLYLVGGKYSLLSQRYKPEHKTSILLDKKIRDSVLKQDFSPHKVPSNLDAIVIGSGIGGLACAVFLARAGKRVLVLEQHDVAGGMCHTWEEHGFEFDVGVHYVGYLDDQDHPITLLMDTLLGNRMDWDAIPGVCDKLVLGNPENQREYLCCGDGQMFVGLRKLFPQEEQGINRLEAIFKAAVKSAEGTVAAKFIPLPIWKFAVRTGLLNKLWNGPKFGNMMLGEVMTECGISSPDLRAALSYLGGDVGLSADEFPILVWANLLDMYHRRCFYPTGGPSEIPFQLIPQIEEAGGRVLVRARVEKILFGDKGKAYGVKVGGAKAAEIYAPAIVSDCGLLGTFKSGIIPKSIAEASRYYKYTDSIGPSIAIIQVFIGFDGSPQELDLPTNNFWVVDDPQLMETDSPEYNMNLNKFMKGCMPFFATTASAKDSSWNTRHPGKSEFVICIKVDYSHFVKFKNRGTVRHRDMEYENLKQEIARIAWDRTIPLLPKKAVEREGHY